MNPALTIWLWFCVFMIAALLVPLIMGQRAPSNWPMYMRWIYAAVFFSTFARLLKLW